MTYKDLTDQELEEKQKDIEMKNEQNQNGEGEQQPLNEELDGNVLIKRKKIQFFKFWPKAQMQISWRAYLETGESQENLNAAYFAVQVLDKTVEVFVLNQIKKRNAKEA